MGGGGTFQHGGSGNISTWGEGEYFKLGEGGAPPSQAAAQHTITM